MSQTSSSQRVVSLVAVANGRVWTAAPGNATWWPAVNNTGHTLNTTGVVYSAANQQKLWFADGTHWLTFDPSTNTVSNWTAASGTLFADSAGNTPRLICTWRGRTVLSGLLLDGQNWFATAVDDPTNFQLFPQPTLATQAVEGNNSTLGTVGDVITGLIPWSDDVLIFGGDHTLWQLQGDPFSGGQIQRLSDRIGMAWGQAYCKDPYQNLWFVSNQMGLYQYTPGQPQPVRVSGPIEQLLWNLDTGLNSFRLIWDDRYQGVHIFCTPTAAAAATTHLFWEQRSNAFFQDSFANANHNPLAVCAFDGNLPADRHALLGSWDGYVRQLSPSATSDDGTAIASSVTLGPILTSLLDDMMLKDIQAVLGETSGTVTYAVYVGDTAEKALSNPAVLTDTWGAGRNLNDQVRRAGHALWIKISSTSAWTLEQIRIRINGRGKVGQRVWKQF